MEGQLRLFNMPVDDYLVKSFSAGSFADDTLRKELENKYRNKLQVTNKFNRQTVSYQLSKKDTLHSWLKYKEGFSASLVNILLNDMGAKPGDWIMDPFMGSGTTALVCKMRGINSIGYDVLPISKISIQAKSSIWDYDVYEIEHMIKDVCALNLPKDYLKKIPYIPITEDAYPEYNERFLQYISDWRDSSPYSSLAKNLLTLAIINSLEQSSYTIKSGQYLKWDCRSKKVIRANAVRAEKGQKLLSTKYVRDNIANIKDVIINELIHISNDIKTVQNSHLNVNKAEIKFTPGSALYELPLCENNSLAGVITSPPYCNRYDYTRTYALELVYLGADDKKIKEMRQSLLSCTVESKSKIEQLKEFYYGIGKGERFEYIRQTVENNKAFEEVRNALNLRKAHHDLNNNGVIRMTEGYFTELAFIYAELYRSCKPGATVAFVNDNVRYGGEVIPVDFLSCSFAEQFGFHVDKIYALKQKKGNSSQQMAKFGNVPLRKSITIWTK